MSKFTLLSVTNKGNPIVVFYPTLHKLQSNYILSCF